MDLQKVLNDKQYLAATTIQSHTRIIAGAGSGKTRVITYRIAYLIEEVGIDPRRILAITFTNKAANEMKTRIENLLGEKAKASTISTIHSLCVRILRDFIYLIDYPRYFVIMDTEDQKSVLKDIYKEIELNIKDISYNSALTYISNCKYAKVTPEAAKEFANGFIGEEYKALIYSKYLEYQEKNHCLDFDDLLLKTEYIFDHFPIALQTWQNKFDYIHVDEFQDISETEYNIIKHLAGSNNILCVVGDPDQTIYTFRGANVNYILDLSKDFPNLRTIILNENYRSTKTILDGANHLIQNNHNRIEKDLYTNGLKGDSIIHYGAGSDEQEASYIVNEINRIIENVDGVNYHDFAILYRANYLSRSIEQELIKNKMDYRIFGGVRFTDRKEVKDTLCYLRAICLKDDLAITRIYNTPARGIGQKSFDKLKDFAARNNLSLYETIQYHLSDAKVTGKAKKGLIDLIDVLEKYSKSKDNYSVVQLIDNLLNETGYMQALEYADEDTRIDNIAELKNMAKAFQDEYEGEEESLLSEFLSTIPLGQLNEESEDGEYISLMTIHMAKGTEFNYVFVMGLSDMIFPSDRSVKESGEEGLEEERRLAYVAFTRAKRKLYLTENCGYSYVTQGPKTSSMFVDEIGNNNVKHIGQGREKVIRNHDFDFMSDEIQYEDDGKYAKGDHIMHDQFGEGIIISLDNSFMKVAFAVPIGVKVLMKNHKSIHKITN